MFKVKELGSRGWRSGSFCFLCIFIHCGICWRLTGEADTLDRLVKGQVPLVLLSALTGTSRAGPSCRGAKGRPARALLAV